MDIRRMVNTKFWSDAYISDLNTQEKLLYIYLFTNERTNICGAYEITTKIISFDTGISSEKVTEMLTRFEDDGKIIFTENYIFMKNFIKHQNLNNGSIRKAVENNLALLPYKIRDEARLVYDSYTTGVRLVDKGKGKGKGKGKEKEIEKGGEKEIFTPTHRINFFANISDQKNTVDLLVENGFEKVMVEKEITKFISYWTEMDTGGKQKWQLQETFDVGRRLTTWFSNIEKFGGGTIKNKVFSV